MTTTKKAITVSRRGVVRCHCGAAMGRVDHCPCCGCEEHERVRDHRCPHPGIRNEANHADRCWRLAMTVTITDFRCHCPAGHIHSSACFMRNFVTAANHAHPDVLNAR